jgi:hypothetical protein
MLGEAFIAPQSSWKGGSGSGVLPHPGWHRVKFIHIRGYVSARGGGPFLGGEGLGP